MFQHYYKIFRFFSLAIDLCVIFFAYILSVEIRNFFLPEKLIRIGYFDFPQFLTLVIVIWGFILLAHYFIYPHFPKQMREELRIGINTSIIGLFIILAAGFLFKFYYPRTLIISFIPSFLLLFIIQKFLTHQIIDRISLVPGINTLIVGTGTGAFNFTNYALNNKELGLRIVGVLDSDEAKIGTKLIKECSIIGSFNQMGDILKNNAIDRVVFSLHPGDYHYLDQLLSVCAEIGVTSYVLPNTTKSEAYKAKTEVIGTFPAIMYSRLPDRTFALLTKRILDIILSASLLVILSPLFLVIAITTKLTSKGLVFYPWRVVGHNNRDFLGYKFRTMIENADELKEKLLDQNEMNGPAFKMKNDPRITSIGKYLRKYSLDELPQLWNVLKGDMSLVGPRPPFREEIDRCEFWQRRKISFKPGITCLWQVSGRNEISDFSDWCRLDLEYIDNWSLWLDFKILLKTAWVVIKGRGY